MTAIIGNESTHLNVTDPSVVAELVAQVREKTFHIIKVRELREAFGVGRVDGNTIPKLQAKLRHFGIAVGSEIPADQNEWVVLVDGREESPSGWLEKQFARLGNGKLRIHHLDGIPFDSEIKKLQKVADLVRSLNAE